MVLVGIICIPIDITLKLASGGITLALTLYFLYESCSSVALLEETRFEMLKRIPQPNETMDAGKN
jgi:hypothetical protein